jgi:type III secretion protein V
MTSSTTSERRARGPYADAALALLLIAIVGMMIVPLPTWLLDLLIAGNLALGVLVLVTAMYVPHGLAFTTMPTVLLLTTLYRLALNVSSTRLILLQADAGRVISAFGHFVVRGDYVVGAVVFLILTLIQYLVVAKGGERVAEVGARFTLDAMPGKQMAIDADLRAGALGIDAARQRRADIERESQFYGAMDGAMKFVKGDAVAGIAIAVISLLGGTAIGVGMHQLSFVQSLRTYGLLTIGDGLVSQIPSLVISTGAGLVVTRVASREHDVSLGNDIADQLLGNPRVLAAGAVFLLLLGLVPGLPALPFLVLSCLLGLGSRALFSRARVATRASALAAESAASSSVLHIELGAALRARLQQTDAERSLRELLSQSAGQLHERLGVHVPAPRISTNAALAPDAYVVELAHVGVLRGVAPAEPGRFTAALAADLPALLMQRAGELLSLDEVKRLLDELQAHSPTLVHSVVPKLVSLPALARVLRALLDEGVSIRPLPRILEALACANQGTQADEHELVERVRRALREPIVQQHEQGGVLRVHRLDPLIEDTVRDAVQHSGHEHYLALAPDLARDIIASVRRVAVQQTVAPVLVTQPDVRRFLRELLAPELPAVAVLSWSELPPNAAIEEREPIALS